MAIASPVLWQNKERTVTVFDIPRSIAAVQGNSAHAFTDLLTSTTPLETPYATNEPKSEKARANLRGNTVDETLHAEYRDILQQALDDVGKHHTGDWCHPRPFVDKSEGTRRTRKRKLSNGDSKSVDHGRKAPISESSRSDLRSDFLANITSLRNGNLSSCVRAETGCCTQVVNHLHGERAFRWNSSSPAELEITYNNDRHSFRLPPASTAFLADCSESRLFHNEIRQQAQDQDSRRHFDLILLDPPWPNRSVTRTHKTPGTTYNTSPSLNDIYNLLLNMDLDMLMADDCLIGIWITNKPAIRDLILNEEYGVFTTWGIELEEEWLWLKTTTSGEPVSPLDSFWRKPYEVLLLGRKIPRSTVHKETSSGGHVSSGQVDNQDTAAIKRRVVISVPDLHSRKPCLKELIEPLISTQDNYRALEVFARHLVTNWWSWGNECMKFNWSGYWNKDELGEAK